MDTDTKILFEQVEQICKDLDKPMIKCLSEIDSTSKLFDQYLYDAFEIQRKIYKLPDNYMELLKEQYPEYFI